MNGSIAPSFVEETTCSVQVIEIVVVGLASPEIHVSDFKVAPEMACRETLRTLIVRWPSLSIRKELESIVGMEVLGMISEEFDRLGP